MVDAGGAEEEPAVVARFQQGERAAFDEIVRTHEPFIRKLVARYVKNEDAAKDVSQLSFLRAFERRASFRGESSFRTWLYRIAVNLSLNHIRQGARDVSIELDDIAAFTSGLETTKLVAAELWRKAEQRLAELPPKQRLVVELRLFHELSFQEISVIADSTEEAARNNFHHGIKSIRAILPKPG
jgi:RNA polymerase sigma-70 factor, ECF subfamily